LSHLHTNPNELIALQPFVSLKRQSLLVDEPEPAMAKHTKTNIFFKLLVGAYNAKISG